VDVGLQSELEEVEWLSDASTTGRAKGGQFGLSLGLLLSRGGMMKPVARVFGVQLSCGPRQPAPAQRGVSHDGRNARTKPCNPVSR